MSKEKIIKTVKEAYAKMPKNVAVIVAFVAGLVLGSL
jgi:hypothetical protein